MAEMTKQAFTEAIAADRKYGLWMVAAEEALKSKRVELYVEHWKEQYLDKGSRPSVERTLGEELTKALVSFIPQNNL